MRRAVQWGLLAGFLALFARTAYRGSDLLDWPVHLVFRLDPLALAAELLAAGPAALGLAWLGAGVLVLATVLLGRFFCGWACPMGTCLDLAGPGLRRLAGRTGRARRPPPWTGLAVLAGLGAAAVAGLPWLGLLDPLSLLLRSLTLTLHPLADTALKAGLGAVSSLSPRAGDLLYRWLDPVLALGDLAFVGAGVTGLVILGIAGLELLAPRFWCTHLCPLGSLLGLLARVGPLRRPRAERCGGCAACRSACPTGAAAADPADPALCIQCGACQAACPAGARRPVLPGARPTAGPVRARRAILGAAGAGLLLGLVPRVRAEGRVRGTYFLRPPGAKPEEELLKRCIRCGACMRVCPRGALHPCLGEAGLRGLWTPRLVPRIGYCEYHCRLCGQVCPTGAIGYLEEGEKERWVIGLAVIQRDRCLPYRSGRECIVCEEHCPTQPKAIVLDDPAGGGARRPRVVEDRCIGCGICETRCPVPGSAAIRVTRENPHSLQAFF